MHTLHQHICPARGPWQVWFSSVTDSVAPCLDCQNGNLPVWELQSLVIAFETGNDGHRAGLYFLHGLKPRCPVRNADQVPGGVSHHLAKIAMS